MLAAQDFADGEPSLTAAERLQDQFVKSEEDRDASVQTRLLGLLGIVSTLGVIISALAAIGVRGTEDLTDAQFVVVVLIVAYVGIQIAGSVLATAGGLGPRTFSILTVETLSPKDDELAPAFRARLIGERRNVLRQNMWVTNRRVEHMMAALDGLRHAVIGSGFLMLALAIVAFQRRFGWCVDWPWE